MIKRVTTLKEKHIFISGYAKPPDNTTAAQLYKIIAVGLKVDRETGVIMEADCSLITDVSKSFIKSGLIGKSLLNTQEIEAFFNDNFFGSTKKALITALKNCCLRYKMIREGLEDEEEE